MATQRTFTAEETQEKFKALPQETKDLLYSTEMTLAIQKIGEKNKLHFDQMGRLEIETTNVLLGFTDTKDYTSILMRGLEIDQVKADAVVQDVNEALFSKIRGAMKKSYEQATAAPVATMSQPAAVATAPVLDAKSVVMPSSIAAKAPVAPAPAASATLASTDMQINAPQKQDAIAAPAAPMAIAPVSKPIVSAPEPDVVFGEPTISMPIKKIDTSTPSTPAPVAPAAPVTPSVTAKVEPPKPAPIYKADPYREPIE